MALTTVNYPPTHTNSRTHIWYSIDRLSLLTDWKLSHRIWIHWLFSNRFTINSNQYQVMHLICLLFLWINFYQKMTLRSSPPKCCQHYVHHGEYITTLNHSIHWKVFSVLKAVSKHKTKCCIFGLTKIQLFWYWK